MNIVRVRSYLRLMFLFGYSTVCVASPISLGYFDFQARTTGNTFVLHNLTGPNDGCNADFPSCTAVNFFDLELDVTRADGTQFVSHPVASIVAGSSLDLLDSLFGDLFSSVRLLGKIDRSSLLLADGSSVSVGSTFDLTLLPDPQSGRFNLSPDTDLALLSVNQTTAVTPEPGAGLLVASGLAIGLLFQFVKTRMRGNQCVSLLGSEF